MTMYAGIRNATISEKQWRLAQWAEKEWKGSTQKDANACYN